MTIVLLGKIKDKVASFIRILKNSPPFQFFLLIDLILFSFTKFEVIEIFFIATIILLVQLFK